MDTTQGLTTSAVLDRISSSLASAGASQRQLLADLAELDRRGAWRRDGCRDMAQWVAARCGISNPGCELKEHLQAHHIRLFPEGPTELWNLILTCHFHHVLLHEFGWKVRLEPDDTATWFRPDGSLYLPGRSPPRLPRSIRRLI